MRDLRGIRLVAVAGMAVLVGSAAGAASQRELAGWSRVWIADPIYRFVFERALDGAALKLTQPECQSVFGVFRDASGTPLSERLAALGLTAGEYLRFVVFVDGAGHHRCRDEWAYTNPGSRVVFVCSRRFEIGWRNDPDHAEASIIHEVLHTLGLGENPPASAEITAVVRGACRRPARHRRRVVHPLRPALLSTMVGAHDPPEP